jgi:hypothetical protein
MILIFRSDPNCGSQEISLETYNGKERHNIAPDSSDSTQSVAKKVLEEISGQATFIIFRFIELLKGYPGLILTKTEVTVGVGISIRGNKNQFVIINPLALKSLNVIDTECTDTIFTSNSTGLFSIPTKQKEKTTWSIGKFLFMFCTI